MTKVIFLILFSLFANPLFANVEFVSPPNPQWEQQTLALMEEVNSLLPASWKRPEDFKVALAPNSEASYYPVFTYQTSTGLTKTADKVLVVTDSSQEKFVHEYAHLIFDNLLRNRVPAWNYYLVWQKMRYGNISETLTSYKTLVVSLEQTHQEFVEKKKMGDDSEMVANVIENTSLSIRQYQDLIVLLEEAVTIEENSPYPLDQFNAFKALTSYNELFADLVASLFVGDWEAMKKSTLIDLESSDLANQLRLPPLETQEAALEAYLNHRTFQEGLSLESYEFKDWEAKSPYLQFAPVRSYLRNLLDSNQVESKSQLIELLAQATLNIYQDEWLKDPTLVERNLYDKNDSLIANMNSLINEGLVGR